MATSVKRKRGPVRRWVRRLALLALVLLSFSVLQVLVLRFVDPPFSAFMAARQFEAWGDGDAGFRVAYDWRDLDAISPHVPVAMIAAEDQRFAEHAGFDYVAIEQARGWSAKARAGSSAPRRMRSTA